MMINYLAGPGRLTLHAAAWITAKKQNHSSLDARTEQVKHISPDQDVKPWITGFSSCENYIDSIE